MQRKEQDERQMPFEEVVERLLRVDKKELAAQRGKRGQKKVKQRSGHKPSD